MRQQSEKLLLDLEEKEDKPVDDQPIEKPLPKDNIDAKATASVVEPGQDEVCRSKDHSPSASSDLALEQEDLNDTERALMKSSTKEEKGQIEFIVNQDTNVISPDMFGNPLGLRTVPLSRAAPVTKRDSYNFPAPSNAT